MRILIADDERLVRYSLRNMLNELDASYKIVGEAKNGQEMIDLTKELHPEVVFVDIKMPKINGLQALKTLKIDFPEIEWVIISGYSEFSYVQEALKLGAADFLLKPPAPSELEEVLKKIINKKQLDLQVKNRDFERKINFHFNNMASAETESWPLIAKSYFQGALLVVDSACSEEDKAAFQIRFCQKIRNIINSTQSNDIRAAIFSLPDGVLSIAVSYGFSKRVESAKRISTRLFNRIEESAMDSGEQGDYVTIMRIEECNSLSEFQESILKLNEISFMRFVSGINRAVSYQTLVNSYTSKLHSSIAGKLDSINNAYQVGSVPEISESITALFNSDLFENDKPLQKNVIDFFRLLYNYTIEDLHAYPLQDELKELLFQRVKKEKTSIGFQDTIQQIIAFLNTNYMNNISISGIADDFNITPNYLSTIFHKKTGTTFLKYLTKVRISRAEELLTETDMKVQDIAVHVGYASTKYFSKAFKRENGCTPSEFKQN